MPLWQQNTGPLTGLSTEMAIPSHERAVSTTTCKTSLLFFFIMKQATFYATLTKVFILVSIDNGEYFDSK